MAKYRLTGLHYINGRLLGSGDELEWDEPPTPDMIPLDEAARAARAAMHWADIGWNKRVTAESLPGGRHSDGSPVLLNRPENLGRPLTHSPPQPRFDREIPWGTVAERIEARKPPEHYWGKYRGSIRPGDPLLPFGGSTPGSKGA